MNKFAKLWALLVRRRPARAVLEARNAAMLAAQCHPSTSFGRHWAMRQRRGMDAGPSHPKDQPLAQYHTLARLYAEGRGGFNRNRLEAVRWYRKAAQHGYAPSQHELGLMYLNGEGVDASGPEALKWLRRAAAQDYPDSELCLGMMYRHGLGTRQDPRQAAAWYRKAAERGHALAQNALGAMLRAGDGAVQDYAQAVYWFQRAAEQGCADAQANLANMYALGWGVPVDFMQAMTWWRKAYEHERADGCGAPEAYWQGHRHAP